jgi:hypothetical protein
VPAVAPPVARGVPLDHAPGAPVAPAPAAGPAPLGRSPHASTPLGPLAPLPRPAEHERAHAAIPAAAWAGLILLAAGVPLGGLMRRRRGRSARAHAATTSATG